MTLRVVQPPTAAELRRVAPTDLRFVKSRASGGYVVHLRRPGLRSAICGFTPSSPRARRMVPRAGWREHSYFDRPCVRCAEIAEAIHRLLGRPASTPL